MQTVIVFAPQGVFGYKSDEICWSRDVGRVRVHSKGTTFGSGTWKSNVAYDAWIVGYYTYYLLFFENWFEFFSVFIFKTFLGLNFPDDYFLIWIYFLIFRGLVRGDVEKVSGACKGLLKLCISSMPMQLIKLVNTGNPGALLPVLHNSILLSLKLAFHG